VLMDNSITRIHKAAKHWVSMVQEPQRKMKEIWVECEKIWEKINLEMKGINFPDFGPPEDFADLQDIVKQHAEQDMAWEIDISQTSSMIPGLSKKFMEAPIKALAVLQCLIVKLIKYKERAIEIKKSSPPRCINIGSHMQTHVKTSSSDGLNMIEIIHCSECIR
jgi:hypothetical protein